MVDKTLIVRNVSEELHRELKIYSAESGKSMNELIINAIIMLLAGKPKS